MDIMRYTIIDKRGGVSFIGRCEAFLALVAACAHNPDTLEGFLEAADTYYRSIKDYVLSGLAVFDEWNVEGNYAAIHGALRFYPPPEHPVFRVVDEVTRETSLRPVKAGVILFNLLAKRIVQIQNSFQEVGRKGRLRVYDGNRATDEVMQYNLPSEWSVVP
ncbi:MAG: hypothetical protein HYU86_02010 [Chloroflexi bacterium]|nr:hypothetical protein [Chloroflexota bacterium]